MKNKNLIQSFKNAFNGLWITYKKEKNFRIQVSFAIVAIYFSLKFKIELINFIFILLAVFLVLSSELFNSALETLADKIEENYDLKIKEMKDTLAGSVLLFSIFSVIIGLKIFLKYINRLDIFSIVFSVIIIVIPFLIKDKNDIIKKRGDV